MNLPEAYHDLIVNLYNEGDRYHCKDWNCNRIEISGTMIVDEPLREPMISKLTICTPESLQAYVMEMFGLKDWTIEASKEPYTYANRIFYQIDACVEELKREKCTTRACIAVRYPADIVMKNPPCLQHIQFMIRDNRLIMQVLFRSNDVCRATFMNAYALIRIQEYVLNRLKPTYPDLTIGNYIHSANSFHAYSDNDGRFKMLYDFVNRIESSDPKDLMIEYEGDWKEMMDDAIEDIEKEDLRQRERCRN